MCRSVNDRGERVAPSDLLEYRRFHKFCGPECMCAIDDAGDNATWETAIFVPSAGRFAGEYVVACAASGCGYVGERHLSRLFHVSRLLSLQLALKGCTGKGDYS
jgi:hypothetical protein